MDDAPSWPCVILTEGIDPRDRARRRRQFHRLSSRQNHGPARDRPRAHALRAMRADLRVTDTARPIDRARSGARRPGARADDRRSCVTLSDVVLDEPQRVSDAGLCTAKRAPNLFCATSENFARPPFQLELREVELSKSEKGDARLRGLGPRRTIRFPCCCFPRYIPVYPSP